MADVFLSNSWTGWLEFEAEWCISSPGSDAKRTRSSETTCPGAEKQKGGRRSELDHREQQNSNQKDAHILTNAAGPSAHDLASLSFIYANAQSLRHKMSELLTTVEAMDPPGIGVSETWGDTDILDAEFSIPGYTMFRSDRIKGHRGGGVLLYIKSELNATEMKMTSKFSDQVWCKISITNGDELLIGVVYRSPNNRENDNSLCNLIGEVGGRPLLLMGDFNYPDIDWSIPCGMSTVSQQFVDSTEDAFLT